VKDPEELKHRVGEEDTEYVPEVVKLLEEVPHLLVETVGLRDTVTERQRVGEMVVHPLMLRVKDTVREVVGVMEMVPLGVALRHWVGVMLREKVPEGV